jgi:hypothetical protein
MKDNEAAFPSFFQYINRVFDFRAHLESLADARCDPVYSAAVVFQAVFYGFLFRLLSFHQLEAEIEEPFLQHWLGVAKAFREGTLRYSYSSFELEPLEEMLVGINRQLKRNKVFSRGQLAGRIVAALDGIEVLSSYSRCCDSCLRRRVREKTKEGELVERIQYYHRLVGCQIVSSAVKPILGVEWLRPGEDEVGAAGRLLEKIDRQYGSRFFDVLLLDSLYAQAPVLRLADEIGWDLVIVLKQEARDLYQDAQGLFDRRGPDLCFSESAPGRTVQVRIWDQDGLPFTHSYPAPVRVLRSDETITEHRVQGGKLKTAVTLHNWVWLSTLDSRNVKARMLWQMGHLRWKNENNGWNDLTQNWMLKHGFLHACKHRVKRIQPGENDEPEEGLVSNRGLPAVVLTLCIVFVLFTAFTLLHSKFYRARRSTYREVAQKLYRSMLWTLPPIRAPDG